MTSLLPYSHIPLKNKQIGKPNLIEKTGKSKFEYIITTIWKNLTEEKQNDVLSFMTTFVAPKLDEMKTTLKESGEYTDEQIEEIIAGLKTLPEYRD